MTNSHPIDRAAQVAATPIRQLAVITLRGLFALFFPLTLAAVLSGFAAGLAVIVFRFTINLF